MTKDLTQGKPMKLVLGFAIPVMFGLLFQQLYNMVDTMIVGKILGEDALAAVGATGSLNFFVIGFCCGLCNGFAIPIAQEFGARKDSNLRRAVANCGWLCVGFSIVLAVITVVFCKPILGLMKTPAEIMERSYSYIVVIFAGIPFIFLYNMVAGIIRSLGDSKTPVLFLGIASVLNIVLDLFFIKVVGTDVEGAAYATVISQAVSGILSLIYMRKKYDILRMTAEERQISGLYIKRLCMVGIPMGLQYSVTAIGSVILQTSVNSLGKAYVASVTAAQKVEQLFFAPYDALGTTMATFGGQNLGAGKLDRVGKGLKSGIIVGSIYSVFVFIVLNLFSGKLALLYVDAESVNTIENVKTYLVINSAFYILLLLVNAVRFMIQGLGFSQFAILAGVLEMIARVIAAVVLIPEFGYVGACLASPLAWLFADLFLVPAYFRCKNKCRQHLGL